MPLFMEPEVSEMMPTTAGPAEQPTSPARASIAYIKVPPPLQSVPAREKTPGHIRPTANPDTAQPARESTGIGAYTVIRYPQTQRPEAARRPCFRLSLCPFRPYNRRLSPIQKAKEQGPSKSPAVLLIPSASSANIEDHWANRGVPRSATDR